ncbi:MAG: hypothetical protein ACYDAQ_05160 [Mycobacteriales bacterium]
MAQLGRLRSVRKSRWPAAAAAAAVLAVQLVGVPRAFAASQPLTDRSFYVQDANTGTFSQLGCNQGNYDAGNGAANSAVVLDFGGQTTVSGGQGTEMTNGYLLTNDQVILDAYNFAYGYFVCAGADTSSILNLFVGTNNSLDVSYSTGQDWGGVVNAVLNKVDSAGYGSQVSVAGADDIEDAFAGPTPTLDWVSGYSAVAQVGYADFGDAGGCPPVGGCLNGWTPQDVYQVAWGSNDADFPTPEIYNSSTGSEWAYLSANVGYIVFFAPLSQYLACQQQSDPCTGTDFTPSQSWSTLDSDTGQATSYLQDLALENG